MFVVLNLLDIKQEQISECHQFIELREERLLSCKWIARCINRCVNPLCFCKLEEFNQKVHLQKRFASADGYSSITLPIRLITKCLLEQIFRSSRFNLDAFI